MRILADENVAGDVVSALREAGHEVVWACTDMPGDDDERLLERAVREKRLLLTNDVDLASIAASPENGTSIGVILIRLRRLPSFAVATAVVEALRLRGDWTGYMAVLSRGATRVRQF